MKTISHCKRAAFLAIAMACASIAAPAVAQSAPPLPHKVMGDIPAPNPRELAAFKAATAKLYALKVEAFAKNQVAPIVERFYAKNAVSMGPEGKPEEGRAEFTASYNAVVPAHKVKVVPIHSWVSGNAGWEWANFHVAPKDPKSEEKPFTFGILFLWAKVKGDWVSAGDMFVVGGFPEK